MTSPNTPPTAAPPPAAHAVPLTRAATGVLFAALGATAILPGLIFTLSLYGAALGIPALLLSAFWLHSGNRLIAGRGPNRTSRWLGGLAALFLLVLWNATLGELALTGSPRHGPFAIERLAQARLFLLLEGPAAFSILWYLALRPKSTQLDSGVR